MKERPIRWGLLSTARINERLIPVIQDAEHSELIAVASRDKEKSEAYAKEQKIPRAYGSYEAMLADPDVDVVYISLPNGLHADWAIQCAQAGKHILCEKPLAVRPEDVDRMAAAAHANNVTLQEAAMMRYHPQTHRVQELIAEGAIGDVRVIRGLFGFTLSRPGDIRLDADLGGGSIWDLGSYPVSFMRGLMKANPVEVQGWQTDGGNGVDVSFSGHMRFESGALAHFFSSFESVPHTEADVIGSTGRLRLDVPWLNKVGVASSVRVVRAGTAKKPRGTFGDTSDNLEEETISYENLNAYRSEIDSMAACILDGAAPILTPDDSRGNVATLVALCKSAVDGRPVQV